VDVSRDKLLLYAASNVICVSHDDVMEDPPRIKVCAIDAYDNAKDRLNQNEVNSTMQYYLENGNMPLFLVELSSPFSRDLRTFRRTF